MSKNCVLKGTLITLNDNKKKIENLKVGEKLLSYSIEGIENTQIKSELGKTKVNNFKGEFSYQLIKNIWKNKLNRYYKINNKLEITGDHYIMCQKQDQKKYFWIQVKDLLLGDSLFKSDGNFENIFNIELIEQEIIVYNIQVNSIYSYFANDYLIHNGAFNCDTKACSACYNAYNGGGGGAI
tara:strand:- start:1139 stop:1684 length:546 start_codon:yes stop_codon:yes gene_type:complete